MRVSHLLREQKYLVRSQSAISKLMHAKQMLLQQIILNLKSKLWVIVPFLGNILQI